jgi:glutamate synthase (NADPH/NADH) small chain
MAFVGTGYSWLRTLFANVGAANKTAGLVTLVGAGRMGFAYPDFARDIIRDGRMYPEKVCVGCSACTQIMRDNGRTGCVVRDNKTYGPIFMHGRMSDRENLLRLASACRKCQEPTCQLACPAGVPIPQFIGLFLDGKEREAYEAIRQANVFPEVCAWLCPVEQQCQGNCLQSFIGDGPLPIADIQRYLAVQANKNGWSKLRIPNQTTGKKIAIIGAGPAGLACAARLLEAGHTVTIFDKSASLGGTVESVIPPDRQSNSLKNELSAIFADVPKDRMILSLGWELAPPQPRHDSVPGIRRRFIGLGLRICQHRESAAQRLVECDGLPVRCEATRRGEALRARVAVIGGSNDGDGRSRHGQTAWRADVYTWFIADRFQEMPRGVPSGPRHAGGAHFLVLTQPLEYEHERRTHRDRALPTRLGDPDASGRRRPELMKSNVYNLNMDMVIEAITNFFGASGDILPGIEFDGGLVRRRVTRCRVPQEAFS